MIIIPPFARVLLKQPFLMQRLPLARDDFDVNRLRRPRYVFWGCRGVQPVRKYGGLGGERSGERVRRRRRKRTTDEAIKRHALRR